MAVLNCEPGMSTPDLVWKASGMRLERSSGGETVVRGCAGLAGVGRSGNESGRRPERPIDELRRPAKRQNTCMATDRDLCIYAEAWAVFEC